MCSETSLPRPQDGGDGDGEGDGFEREPSAPRLVTGVENGSSAAVAVAVSVAVNLSAEMGIQPKAVGIGIGDDDVDDVDGGGCGGGGHDTTGATGASSVAIERKRTADGRAGGDDEKTGDASESGACGNAPTPLSNYAVDDAESSSSSSSSRGADRCGDVDVAGTSSESKETTEKADRNGAVIGGGDSSIRMRSRTLAIAPNENDEACGEPSSMVVAVATATEAENGGGGIDDDDDESATHDDDDALRTEGAVYSLFPRRRPPPRPPRPPAPFSGFAPWTGTDDSLLVAAAAAIRPPPRIGAIRVGGGDDNFYDHDYDDHEGGNNVEGRGDDNGQPRQQQQGSPLRAWRRNSGLINLNRMPEARVDSVVDGTVVTSSTRQSTGVQPSQSSSSLSYPDQDSGDRRGGGGLSSYDEDRCEACAGRDRCTCPSDKSRGDVAGRLACSRKNGASMLTMAAILIVVVAGISVGAVFIGRGTSLPAAGNAGGETASGFSSSSSHRYVAIKSLLESVTESTIAEYYDVIKGDGNEAAQGVAMRTTTPQSRAVTWLADEDGRSLPLDDVRGLVQRYALATVYFATGGGGGGGGNHSHSTVLVSNSDDESESSLPWTDDLGFLSDEHECQWNRHVEEYYNWPGWLLEVRAKSMTTPDMPPERRKGVLCREDGVVEKLWLAENGLSGTLPEEIGLLFNLTELWFSTNDVGGSLPQSLLGLTELEKLAGSLNNRLTGTLPPSLGHDLKRLRVIWLEGNLLTGPIPNSLVDLPSLEVLDFGPGCHLTGTIPPFRNEKLRILSLDFCSLTGTVPPSLFSLPELKELYLTDNLLTGPIPTNMGRAAKLEMLLLGGIDPDDVHNDLTGNIPSSIFNLTELFYLDLLGNRLSGTLSSDFAKLEKLRVLYLADNSFTGTVPDEAFSRLTNLEVVSFGINPGLHGDINFLCDSSPSSSAQQPPLSFGDCLPGNAAALVNCSCCTYCCNQDLFEAGEGYYGCFLNE